jgi:predicted DNA-binding transcriptional regulator YafY
MRKKSRLFAIAEYLRGRRTGVRAEELAERFGVTLRTIYRDLDALRDAELPLRADRGPGGGYALDRAYTLPPVNLTAREAALLVVLGRMATELRLVPFTGTLETALDKVRGALSQSAQRELLGLVQTLQFVGVPTLPVPPAVRKAIEEAWFDKRPVRVHFRDRDSVAGVATVRVTGILMERTATTLVGEDVETGAKLTVRLDRVDRAEVLRGP